MAVQEGPTFKRYTANGVTTVFTIPFLLLDAGDLVVTLDDVPVTSGFTLTGIGDPESTATFAIAPTGDLLFRLVITFERLFDYQENGDFLADTVNDDFDRIWLALKELRRFDDRSLRVSDLEPEGLPNLPSVAERVGKLLSFDSFGNPIAVAGDSQSATELSLLLAASDGSSLVGHGATTVGAVLDQLGYVEHFGLVNTPEAAFVTWQTAINWCAANNVVLRAMAAEYTIDFSVESLTIPDNFRCDLGNAWIKRATGNSTPHDMWINADTANGNVGLDIRNVRFDGQRQTDGLSNATVAHRFCGLRLVKCEGRLHNVRVDNTVNGEIQAEGTRTAIVLTDSVRMVCTHLFGSGNFGTAFMAENGLVYCNGGWFSNNEGSGSSVRNCDDSVFIDWHSDGSGYSGLGFNAQRLIVCNCSSKNSPLNYAGINFGHNSELSRADNCIAFGLQVSDCGGWGFFADNAPNLTVYGLNIADSVTRGADIRNSPNVRLLSMRSRNAQTGDLTVNNCSAYIDADFAGSASSSVTTSNGSIVEFSESSLISGAATNASGVIGGIAASAGCTIDYRGKITNSLVYGAISSGAGAKVRLLGARTTGSASANVFTSAGGVIEYENARFSNTYAMSGTFTIAAGTSSVVVNNGNVADANRISIMPTNSESRLGAVPLIQSISAGVSFTASIGSNTTNSRTYSYVIL